jgi:IS5 family transposase
MTNLGGAPSRPCPLHGKEGEILGAGTIVDTTIIAAPSSTKTATKARDAEMHQTRKGQQWYFGMKLHIGVDSKSKLSPRDDHDGGECA